MAELKAFLFCAAIGFAAAATLSSFYQWVTSERADFSIARVSLPALALTILMAMFAGPFILWQKVLTGLRSREMQMLPAAVGVVLSGMWSVCAGIFYLSLLLSV